MSKNSFKNAKHIKIQRNGKCWTIYRDNEFIAKGTNNGGGVIIEVQRGEMREDLIVLLIEDAIGSK